MESSSFPLADRLLKNLPQLRGFRQLPSADYLPAEEAEAKGEVNEEPEEEERPLSRNCC